MSRKYLSIFSLLILTIVFPCIVRGQALNPRFFNERFIIRAMMQIGAAEATFNATTGAGNFGTLAQLADERFIDQGLAQGSKHGYVFELQTTPWSAGSPAGFVVTATPRIYRKSGERSFYLDQTGELRGGDKRGLPASATDPFIDSCVLWGLSDNERCTIQDMRLLPNAQYTFQSTVGNGNFGTFEQLHEANLIRGDLADLTARGYTFSFQLSSGSAGGSGAAFKIWAVPQVYGVTGRRSFFVDQTGIVRAADRNGQKGDESDPPLEP